MKKTLLMITALLFTVSLQAQKVKEKDVIGTWKMVIDIESELDKEAEDADSILEEVIIKTVSGFVEGIMDDIEIYFEFKKNKEVLITVNAYDESETEKGTWFINKRGYLEMDDVDDDDFNIQADDDEWKLIDGLLINSDHENDRNVYMTRVN